MCRYYAFIQNVEGKFWSCPDYNNPVVASHHGLMASEYGPPLLDKDNMDTYFASWEGDYDGRLDCTTPGTTMSCDLNGDIQAILPDQVGAYGYGLKWLIKAHHIRAARAYMESKCLGYNDIRRLMTEAETIKSKLDKPSARSLGIKAVRQLVSDHMKAMGVGDTFDVVKDMTIAQVGSLIPALVVTGCSFDYLKAQARLGARLPKGRLIFIVNPTNEVTAHAKLARENAARHLGITGLNTKGSWPPQGISHMRVPRPRIEFYAGDEGPGMIMVRSMDWALAKGLGKVEGPDPMVPLRKMIRGGWMPGGLNHNGQFAVGKLKEARVGV